MSNLTFSLILPISGLDLKMWLVIVPRYCSSLMECFSVKQWLILPSQGTNVDWLYYFFHSFFLHMISFLLSTLQSNIWDIFDIFPFLLYYHPDLCRLQYFSIEGLEITMFVLKFSRDCRYYFKWPAIKRLTRSPINLKDFVVFHTCVFAKQTIVRL